MTHLRRLKIYKCSELIELPEQLWSLTTLREVVVVLPSKALKESVQNVKVIDGYDLFIA